MKTPSLLALLVAAASCGGSTTEPVAFDDFGTFNGARVEVVAEGGIAALSVTDRVSHDDRAYVHVQRHLCSTSCAAPMDSTSGTLGAAATDSLFNIVLAQKAQLKDDYGVTPNAADMFAYTVRITTTAGTKTIRADDGTMPPQLRQIVDAVRGTIAFARK